MRKQMEKFQNYIDKKNAETREWVNADDGRWAGMVPDADWWAKERGVHTIEQYLDYTDRATHYDLYKDVYGIRPRHTGDWTIEQIRDDLDRLFEQLECDHARREAQEKADEAKAKELCVQFNCTREDLTRWDVI